MPGFRSPDKPKDETPISVKAARGQAPLSKLYGHLKADATKAKRLGPLQNADKAKQFGKEKILQVGVVRELTTPLNPLIDSASYVVTEGQVRVAAIISEGARQMRLKFKDFSLPEGARVFVYSASDPNLYFGPYEGRGPWGDGTFWTPSLPDDQVVIEYTAPLGTGDVAPFSVSQVAHIYKDTPTTDDPAGACNLEVTAPWAEVAKSIGMIQFIKNDFVALCTGTLLNDSDTTQDHHLLTANHCVSSQSEAQTVTVYWNYITGDTPPGGTPTTSGANMLVTSVGTDFSLLRLTGALPGGLFFSGWDASAVSSGTSVTGIHHPEGSHKRISFGATNSDCDSQLPGPCANFTGVTWSQGTTEDGSSGSGIWTGTPDTEKLVGTLTGGYAACDNLSGTDFYARFSVIYQSGVAIFLEPHRTLTVASVNPNSGIGILVMPNDLNNQGSGSTPFTRSYFHNATVTLVANTNSDGPIFQKWQRDGQDYTTSAFTTVTMNSDHTMTAVYVPRPTFALTVASSNPSSGVNITVTPNDKNGSGNGTTEFTRTYIQNANVNLAAPTSANGNTFWKWRVDGVDFTTSTSTTLTMDA
ncbi:MAG TPA: trypsin-like serine protease, partial [Pyrinomonadaceae bacterium]